jgi:hypothetical protein
MGDAVRTILKDVDDIRPSFFSLRFIVPGFDPVDREGVIGSAFSGAKCHISSCIMIVMLMAAQYHIRLYAQRGVSSDRRISIRVHYDSISAFFNEKTAVSQPADRCTIFIHILPPWNVDPDISISGTSELLSGPPCRLVLQASFSHSAAPCEFQYAADSAFHSGRSQCSSMHRLHSGAEPCT